VETGTFDGAVEHLVAAVLASPDFLFRAIDPPRDAETAAYALDDFELASRLAFFIWGRGPDDELLALAEAGKLRDERVLEAQAVRLFADPRAETLVEDSRCAGSTSTTFRPSTPTPTSSRRSATRCARTSRPRWSSSCAACCSKTATCRS
jgi:hypothetical protein